MGIDYAIPTATALAMRGRDNMHRTLFNTGKFGRTKQVTLFKKENSENEKRDKENKRIWQETQNHDMFEEQGFHPCNDNYGDVDMPAQRKKTYRKGKTSYPPRSSGRSINNDVDAWLNLGGKAFFVKIDGVSYMTSIESVQDLLNGNKKGVKLGLIEE